ncbi:MAG TPA: glutaredoxin domain-containing protein [Burkholderiales bacterium]|nr:glutaredoxin domain-containing protein [Burkholderiales bacterium]
MRRIVLGMVLLAASGAVLAAQLYRWVDEMGNVEYRDTPPPASAKKVETRSVRGGTVETPALPYSVQQAVLNFPVTLWNSDCGAPCDQARAHLARRGVPHTEKDPQTDFESFKKLTGGLDVPVLFVGANRIKGYLEGEWDAALDIAGYPSTPPLGFKPAAKPGAPAKAMPPVKLYTHPQCGPPCNEARNLLAGRGVKYEDITAQEQAEIDELQRVSGDTKVPVLIVGQVITRGFSAPDYNLVLDAAGFPRSEQAARQ